MLLDSLPYSDLSSAPAESQSAPSQATASRASQSRQAHTAALLAQAAKALRGKRFAVARRRYEQVLAADPVSRPAHAGLYYACTALGDGAAAATHLARALMLQSIVTLPFRGLGEPVSILLVQSIQAGNALVQRLLDDRIFAIHVLLVEFFEPGTPLPPHHVVFNAIGDADIRGEALAAAERVLQQTTAPVLNAPRAVRATTRAGNAQRLAGLPGVRTARTVLLPHAALLAKDAGRILAFLAEEGLRFPLLLRAPGFHMGKHFVRVESESHLPEAVAGFAENSLQTTENGLLAMEFLNGRGSETGADAGLFRKYRVLFIDGEFFPVHLAASEEWKIHYFSAEMAEYPERRAEDKRFLADMPGVLGSRVMQALAAIRDALALDYGGVDFGIDRDGNLLLYEANANMAVIHPGPEPIWDYRRPAIDRIYTAVHTMLLRRAAVSVHSR